METRVEALERRLELIEARLGIRVESPSSSEPDLSSNQSPKTSVVETSSGGKILGAIAVFFFVLAGMYMVKLAIDSGWLTPARQLGLTALFGLTMVAGAFWVRRFDSPYSGYLAATGVVVLFLAAYGGHLFFRLLALESSVIAVGVVGLFSLWLYRGFLSDLFIVTAALGVYVAPLLLGIGAEGRIETQAIYVLAWSAIFCVASWMITNRRLTLVAAYCAFGSVWLLDFGQRDPQKIEFLLAVQLSQFVFFLAAVAYYSIRSRKSLEAAEAYSFAPVLLVFYASTYSMIERLSPMLAPWISLGFAGVLLGVYQKVKTTLSQTSLPSQTLVVGFAALALFHSLYLKILPDDGQVLLLLVLVAVFSVGQTHLGAERFATAFSPVTAVSALVVLIEILKLFWRLGMESSARDLFSAGWTVTFLIYGHLAFSLGGKRRSEGSSLVLGTAHALAVSALYRLVVDVSSLAVSGVWALYALAVLCLAFLKRDASFAKSSLLVLAVAAGKVLIYDVASSPALIRILCLVLTGVLLYLSGFLFRKIGNFENAGT